MRAGDDVPPHDRNLNKIRKAVSSEKFKSPKHAIVEDNGRYRCLWCLKTAATAGTLMLNKCGHSGGHNLWQTSGLTICSRCGGYSQFCARLLGAKCRGTVVSSSKHLLKRVFVQHLHPVEDMRIQRPVFWRSCAQQQSSSQELRVLADDTPHEDPHDLGHPHTVLELAETFISDEDCNLKGYGSSDADAAKYADAVIGANDKVDSNGMRVSHVGEATCGSSSLNWEPWVGQRPLRPFTVAQTGRGATIRNRFCFNSNERERRQRGLFGQAKAK